MPSKGGELLIFDNLDFIPLLYTPCHDEFMKWATNFLNKVFKEQEKFSPAKNKDYIKNILSTIKGYIY